MKKLLAMVLALTMMLGCVAFAEEETAAPALQHDLYVLFTSDVHCGVDQGWTYVGVDTVRNNLISQGYNVALVDNGDSIQGEPIGTMTSGSADIDLMNAMKYDVATIGNHEFDYGMDTFLTLAKEKAEYPYISCNFNYKGELVFPAYLIKEYDGVKVAFVGVTTPKTLTSSTPKYFMDENGEYVYGFFSDETGELLYSKVQEAVDAARAEGAQYVILMAHLGNEGECIPYTYADVLANTTGIDICVDGHSHDTDTVSMTNKNGDTVLRQGCGTKLEGIGYACITTDGSMSTGVWLWENDKTFTELTGVTSDMTAAIESATAELDASLQEVVAHTSYDLIISDPAQLDENGKAIRIIRTSETNLGDLCADAYRAASGADVAIVNGGGIRVAIPAGDITREQILKVHPFGNEMCVVKCSGQEILDALEYSVYAWPSEFGGFLQVSGMTFEVHTYIESPVVRSNDGMLVEIKDGERRIKNVMIGDEPLDPEKEYTLASHNYKLHNMGDGYTMFTDNEFTQDSVMLDNQVLLNYLTQTMNGEVDSQYEDIYGQGRITFVTEAPAAN